MQRPASTAVRFLDRTLAGAPSFSAAMASASSREDSSWYEARSSWIGGQPLPAITPAQSAMNSAKVEPSATPWERQRATTPAPEGNLVSCTVSSGSLPEAARRGSRKSEQRQRALAWSMSLALRAVRGTPLSQRTTALPSPRKRPAKTRHVERTSARDLASTSASGACPKPKQYEGYPEIAMGNMAKSASIGHTSTSVLSPPRAGLTSCR
mmetsp:Transcript_11891/g.31432  ORF Transcript_11891/g.31432 Transcript_11891/m.31432 type:complete len:210 (+) Transcript_11891:957-1586(+)